MKKGIYISLTIILLLVAVIFLMMRNMDDLTNENTRLKGLSASPISDLKLEQKTSQEGNLIKLTWEEEENLPPETIIKVMLIVGEKDAIDISTVPLGTKMAVFAAEGPITKQILVDVLIISEVDGKLYERGETRLFEPEGYVKKAVEV